MCFLLAYNSKTSGNLLKKKQIFFIQKLAVATGNLKCAFDFSQNGDTESEENK